MSDFPISSWNPGQVVLTPAGVIGQELSFGIGGAVVRTSAAWPVANLAIFIPFVLTEPLLVVKMFCENGATASGNLDAGIYSPAGDLIVSKGSTAQSGASAIQTLDITDTLLNPGLYYMALALNGTTGTVARFAQIGVPGTRAAGVLQAASSFVLPSTVTYAAMASDYIPSFGLTGNTVI